MRLWCARIGWFIGWIMNGGWLRWFGFGIHGRVFLCCEGSARIPLVYRLPEIGDIGRSNVTELGFIAVTERV